MAFACVPEVLSDGSDICFSSAVLPHAGQAGTVAPSLVLRTSASNSCWQAVQTKSNIGILAVSPILLSPDAKGTRQDGPAPSNYGVPR